jgi:hypothetical protein
VRPTTLSRSLALAGLTLLAQPLVASAQTIAVRAYLSPGNTVAVGTAFDLNVEITGTRSLTEEPELPDLGSFAQYLGSNTQSAMRMTNGRTTVSITVQYRYQALVEGSFEIPALSVPAGGQVYTTEPIQVTVSANPQPASGAQQQGGAGGPSPDDLFVTAEVSRENILEGEPFVVEYRLWTRIDVSSYNFTRIPEPEGFWVEDVTPPGQPQVEQQPHNGETFTTAIIRRVALVATGPGERTIEPVGLEAQIRVRRDDPFERMFGRSSLFGTSVTPMAVLSNALTLDIQPLPPGRPEPFSGVVGTLAVSASLDRDSLDANEAVTLTVRVTGQGNIRAVPEPVLDLPPDFEAFPPEVSESVRGSGSGLAGEKVFEYVLIPRAPGQREIPSVTMGYFDQALGAYRIAESGVLSLTVTGIVVDGPAALARGGVSQLREDIRFIHLGTASLRRADSPLFAAVGFWMFALLPLAGMVGAVALRRQRDLLEGDVAYARGRRASKVAKKRLAEARQLAEGENARAFYAEVDRALRGLVSDRLNLAEAGLQTADLGVQLASGGVDDGTVIELKSFLDHCDRQRFAPPGSDPEEKTRFLDRAADLMTTLDRAMRR